MRPHPLLSLIFLLFASCAQEERAARIINAFVTKVQFNADGSTTMITIPDEVSCGDKRYLIDGGDFHIDAGHDPVDGKYLVPTQLALTLNKATEGFPAEVLTCNFIARWRFDWDLRQYRGGGLLEDCATYSCKLGTYSLDCGKMKAALAQFRCSE